MSQTWFHLNSGPGPAAHNMAVDEALLESVAFAGQPILRFYGWTETAATFGYSQRFDEIAQATQLRPLVRRMTGGGLVPHDADWTYAFVVPPGHEWYELRAIASYRRIHEWIHRAFAAMNVVTEIASCCRKGIPGQCFAGWEQYDLLWQGKKIAGAAQRRNKQGLLIQGSVQPPSIRLQRTAWTQAMIGTARCDGEISWESYPMSPAREQRMAALVDEKYGSRDYTEKR